MTKFKEQASPEYKKLLSDSEVSRLMGALEFAWAEVFGKYLDKRSINESERDFRKIEKLLKNEKMILFIAKMGDSQYTLMDHHIRSISDEEMTELYEIGKKELFSSKDNCVILPNNLPEPDISFLLENFAEKYNLSRELITLWVKFINLVNSLSVEKINISSLEHLRRKVVKKFDKILASAKKESLEYHHMGSSQYDDYIGRYETNMEIYHKFIRKFSTEFRKKHKKVIKKFNLEDQLNVVEETAMLFEGTTEYVDATITITNPNIPPH